MSGAIIIAGCAISWTIHWPTKVNVMIFSKKNINYYVLHKQNPATSAWRTMGTTATESNGASLQQKLKYAHDSLAI